MELCLLKQMQPRRGFGVINEISLPFLMKQNIQFPHPNPPAAPPPRPLKPQLQKQQQLLQLQNNQQKRKKRFWKFGVNILYIVETYLSWVRVCVCV